MAWLRIDDGIIQHPKLHQAGPLAGWLWLTSLCYCRRFLTDGRFPKAALSLSGIPQRKAAVEAARLVSVGLWHDEGGDWYLVHDFLEWNPSRNDVESSKEWDRRRKELYADKDLVHEIRARDGDTCRYCGVEVSWSNRRGPGGGQFDHVVPRGPNTADNIVVSCRRCNAAKNGRTPDDAGMPLRPVKNQTVTSSSLVGISSASRVRAGHAISVSASVSDSGSGSDGGVGETPEQRLWTAWRGHSSAAGDMLPIAPRHHDLMKLVEACGRVPDESKLHAALSAFWALDERERVKHNVKSLTLGYFVMALPVLLTAAATSADAEREKFLKAVGQ